MKTKPYHMLTLALFMIIYGILNLTNITFVWASQIEGLLALATGILWFLDKE